MITKLILLTVVIVTTLFLSKIDKFIVSFIKDNNLKPFIKSLSYILLRIVIILSMLYIIGVDSNLIFTVVGSVSIAIGIALQSSVSNIASGILILTFKSIELDQIITVQSITGKVIAIEILYTILLNSNNEKVIIPNNLIISSVIIVK